MSRFHTVKVFVDGFDDLFAEIIREFIGGNDDAFHGYGADILFLSRIGTLRYGDLGEVWILLHQLVSMFCIDIDQCCGFIGSQILDRCGREACDDDADIDIAILQCISSFAEGEILYIDIIIGQAICTKDLTGIRFCTGTGSTDSDLFALEVSDGFNDISMIEYAGLGVAMANAAEEVRARANYVAPHCDEDGLVVDYEIEGDFPRYGNDDDRADEIAVWLLKTFMRKIEKHHTYRDSEPTTSILTITSS